MNMMSFSQAVTSKDGYFYVTIFNGSGDRVWKAGPFHSYEEADKAGDALRMQFRRG